MNLLKNSKTLHVVCELLVVLAIIFWFSTKHRQLSKRMEHLLQRFEDQELHLRQTNERMNQLEALLQSQSSRKHVVEKKDRGAKQSKGSEHQNVDKVHQAPSVVGVRISQDKSPGMEHIVVEEIVQVQPQPQQPVKSVQPELTPRQLEDLLDLEIEQELEELVVNTGYEDCSSDDDCPVIVEC